MATTDPDPIRVFLIDDHEVVRLGVADLVNAENDMVVTGGADSVSEAVRTVAGCEPDVAVIDVRLGDETGMDACRRIREIRPEVACVMLTSFDDDDALLEAAEAGAVAFLLKQVRSNEIVETIRKVAAGAQLLDEAVLRLTRRRLKDGELGLVDSLSAQERRVFDLIGDGRTNRQIADEMFLAEKTVKNYVTAMLAKLQLTRRTEAAAMATRIRERQRRRFE